MAARDDNGGVPARRAVVRWAWRLFRREWRQQALVLALLIVTLAAAIGYSAATYNTFGVPENAMFGSANHRYEVDEPDMGTLPDDVAAATETFGVVDVIARWFRAVPGSVESVEYRAQDPGGPFSSPMLGLRDGRYPARHDEAALTDGVADMLQLDIGDTLGLDGHERTVVGVVENPSDLNSEFALVAPNDVGLAESVTILIGGSGDFDEVQLIRDFGSEHLPEADVDTRDDVTRATAAVEVLSVALVVLVLVSLVAAAGFVAVAQRRLRQLGMLGAVGATEKHLRLVVLANGAVIGAVAAVIGAIVGMVVWVGVAPRMERAVGHRIDPFDVPWWVVVTAMLMVVVTATSAAWWPALTIARVPITSALSGRPPTPRPVHRSVAVAGVLIAVGLGLLTLNDRSNVVLISGGAVTIVLGVMLLSPLAIELLASIVRPLPVAIRLALRDLCRYRARSGVALAAVSLALGIPVAIVVTAGAAAANEPLGNLGEGQLLIWTRHPSQPEGVSPFYTQDPNDEGFAPYLPDLTAADLAAMGAEVEAIAAELGARRVVGLDVAVDPAVEDDPEGRRAVTLARPSQIGYLDVALLYIGSDELLALHGIEPDEPIVDADIITTAPAGPPEMVLAGSDELWLTNMAAPPVLAPGVATIDASYTSLPGSFLTPDAQRARGWQSARVGWLIESDTPFAGAQLVAARDAAADAGLLVEAPRPSESVVALRWGATAAGMLLALGVLAMTVGLIRAEAAGDVRTLTATGATSTIRRALVASTAGGLALLGALLGTTGAYLALSAGYIRDVGSLSPVPVVHLAVICLGVPLVAVLAGWLLAGREPPVLARQPIE